MKKNILMLGLLVVSACSSTRFVDSWRNTEVTAFNPNKLLVIGLTDNLTARKIFEERLKTEFTQRNIDAYESTEVLDGAFTDSRKSEQEIDAMKEQLITDGYDAVIISAVIGVNTRQQYRSGGYYTFGPQLWYRFGPYYYRFQDVYFTPGYYNEYQVYQVETSIYNLKKEGNKSLIWVGTFTIVDPSNITAVVNDYVKQIITQLQVEGLITTPL
jgi:hypothetical protein